MKSKSVDQKIQETVFTDQQLDREELKKYLVKDMKTCVVFMNEVLSIPAAVDALTDVYYERYKKYYEEKNQVPDPDDVPASLDIDPNQKEIFK